MSEKPISVEGEEHISDEPTHLAKAPEAKLHGGFSRGFWLAFSALGSFWFVQTMVFGAIFYHLYHLVTGKEKEFAPGPQETHNGYVPRQAYPDLKNLKITTDLGYYARELGLDLEEYQLTTDDDFIIPLHRLIDPRETAAERDAKKPFLLQHGLLASSGCYLVNGTNSLAYYFHEMGYDVWMGNNRTHFAPKHASLKGNLMRNEKMWDWDIRELAYMDLPCIISNVLSHKPNHSKLLLMGHSQGCTQSFLLLKNQELLATHEQIEMFFPMAPAIFPGLLFIERRFLKFIHNKGRTSYKIIFGFCSFLKILGDIRNMIGSTALYNFSSYIMFKFLFGWRAKKWSQNKKVRHINSLYNLPYVSAKLMNWWLSRNVLEGFSNQVLPLEDYKNGNHYKYIEPVEETSKSFFPYTKSWLEHLSVPITIFSGDLDFLVDGKRLISHMRFYEPTYAEGKNLKVIEIDDYSHVDVIWSDDCIGKIGVIVHEVIQQAENKESN